MDSLRWHLGSALFALIPEFRTVLGYVDDLIIVPLGILVVARLMPPHVLAGHRVAAAAQESLVSRS